MTINNANAAVTATANIAISNLLTVNTNATFSGVISGTAAVTKAGTGSTLTLSGTNTYTGGTTIDAGTISISSNSNLGATSGGLSFANGGILQTTGGTVVTSARTVTLNSGGGVFDLGIPLYLSGAISGSGGFTTGGSDLILNRASGTNAIGPIVINSSRLFIQNSLNNIGGSTITVKSGATLDIDINAANSLTNTVTFESGACLANRQGTLTVNTSSVTFPSTGSMCFNSDDQPTTAITVNGSYPTLTGDLVIQVGGSNATVGTVTLSSGLNGSSYNLEKTSTGTLSFGTGAVSLNNLTISGGSLTSTSATMSLAGNFTNNSTFTHNSGTVNFNGTTQAIGGSSSTTFNNLTFAGGSTTSVNTSGTFNTTLTVNGTLVMPNAISLSTDGTATLTMGSGGLIKTADADGLTGANASFPSAMTSTSINTNGTIEYNGANQTVTDRDYNNLIFSGSGTKSWAGTTARTVNGNLTIESGSTLSVTATKTINVAGNWTNSGTFTAGTGTVILNGSSSQSIGGTVSTTFNNLTIDNASGVSLSQAATVNSTLTLTSGLLTLGGNNLTMGSSAPAISSPGFSSTRMIVADGAGSLCKVYSVTGNYDYPIGDTSGDNSQADYSAASLNVTGDTFPDTLCVRVTDAIHPDNDATTAWLTRYWTATRSGSGSFSSNVTFKYVVGTGTDVFGTEGDLWGAKWDGSTWTPLEQQVNTVTHAVVGTGVTSFSDFTAGDAFSSLPVTLMYFQALRQGNDVAIAWSTGTETGNVGFNIYVETPQGRQKLNTELIPATGVTTHEPQDYLMTFSNVQGSSFYLEDVDVIGRTRLHGPFELGVARGKRVVGSQTDWAAIRAGHDRLKAEREAQNVAKVKDALQRRGRGGLFGLNPAPAPAAGEPGLGQPEAPGKPRPTKTPRPTSTPKPTATPLPTSTPTPEPSPTPSPTPTEPPPAPGVKVGELLVGQSGLYRVTYEDLLASGLDLSGQPSADLALTDRGQPVAISVSGGATFGPGAYIEFLGQARQSLYSDTNVYTLWLDRNAALRVVDDYTAPDPLGQPAAFYLETALVNRNRGYDELSTTGDPWYDTYMYVYSSPNSWNYTVSVDHFVPGLALESLWVQMYGGSNYAQNPDHHLAVLFNNLEVANRSFDGLKTEIVQAGVPNLVEGSNTLTLRLLGDTGALADVTYLDQWSVSYPRSFWAVDGRLKFAGASPVFSVDNLGDASVTVYREENGILTKVNVVEVSPQGASYTARFSGAGASATYYVASAGGMLKPGIQAARPLADIKSGSAQYLVIAHPDFIAGLAPLVQARQSAGLSVKVVDVLDIYDQYSYGMVDAQAIKDYVAYAAGNLGTQYVLLVGDDTYDYKGYAGTGSISFIPSIYMAAGDMVQYAPVDPKYADVNNDNVPDVAIGRFAVRTPTELSILVSKTLAYGNKNYGKTSVFTADWSYGDESDTLIGKLAAGWSVVKAYLEQVGVSAAHNTLIGQINAGVALTSFVGHSDDWEWTWDGLLTIYDLPYLTNAGRPTVVTQNGCWNIYYVNSKYETLADEMLNKGDRGAAAMFGSTTLTSDLNEQKMGELFMPLLTQPGTTLGQALLQAKQALAASNPGALDVLLGWSLLGDPYLMVQP